MSYRKSHTVDENVERGEKRNDGAAQEARLSVLRTVSIVQWYRSDTVADPGIHSIGVSVLTTALPVVCYALTLFCNDISGCPVPSLLHPSTFSWERLKEDVGYQGISTFFNFKSLAAVIGWFTFNLIQEAFLPAPIVEGTKLVSGGKLKYRMNAFNSALSTLALAGAGTLIYGAEFPVWTFIWDNYIPILTASQLIAFSLACSVYYHSFSVHPGNTSMRELAAGGRTGNLIYDWFIGRELNPRIQLPIFGEVDIKLFMEIRPGLVGWLLLDFAFVAHQYRTHGLVTDSMLLATAFHSSYVFDALWNEPAILTTIDITTDGFGFMLAFGDLVWVPFVYCLQARYLAMHPLSLGPYGVAAVLALQALGYSVFRLSNNEKNRFRSDPDSPQVAHLEYIETAAGSRLLTSGWWGTARHINYTADWIMSWAWCLTTGLAGFVVQYSSPSSAGFGERSPADGSIFGGQPVTKRIVPGDAKGYGMIFGYFYMIYFGVLLVHREMRDEEKCAGKYGSDWERYKQKVRYRLIPGIY